MPLSRSHPLSNSICNCMDSGVGSACGNRLQNDQSAYCILFTRFVLCHMWWCLLRHQPPVVVAVRVSNSAKSELYSALITLQALGAVPYVVVLDQETDSVVVAIRGSDSAADWVTDFLATPEPLDDWLPAAFCQVRR